MIELFKKLFNKEVKSEQIDSEIKSEPVEEIKPEVIEETKQKDPFFKVKVEPFDSECTHYSIHYSFNNGILWHRYETNMLWDKESLCSRYHPVLSTNFDKAINIALSLTPENIKQHKLEKEAEYEEHMKKMRSDIEKRNKKFIS